MSHTKFKGEYVCVKPPEPSKKPITNFVSQTFDCKSLRRDGLVLSILLELGKPPRKTKQVRLNTGRSSRSRSSHHFRDSSQWAYFRCNVFVGESSQRELIPGCWNVLLRSCPCSFVGTSSWNMPLVSAFCIGTWQEPGDWTFATYWSNQVADGLGLQYLPKCDDPQRMALVNIYKTSYPTLQMFHARRLDQIAMEDETHQIQSSGTCFNLWRRIVFKDCFVSIVYSRCTNIDCVLSSLKLKSLNVLVGVLTLRTLRVFGRNEDLW